MDFNVKNNKCNYIIEARKWYECAKNDILNGKEPPDPKDEVVLYFFLCKMKRSQLVIDIDPAENSIRASILRKNDRHF